VNSSLRKLALIAALLVIVLAVLFFVFRSGDDDQLALNQPSGEGSQAEANVEVDPEYIIVGGVRRKASDVKRVKRAKSEIPRPMLDTGRTEPVAFDLNANTKSIHEALETKQYPERLSPKIQPKPFDAEQYRRDPQAYLNVVEPGRVWQSAQPGPGVEVLKQLTPRYTKIKQGESVKLRVQAVPRAPVTFHSFDLGRFSANQLTTLSVQADDQGIAEAEFVGSEGTYNNVNILAASPLTTGQVKFIVYVETAVRTE